MFSMLHSLALCPGLLHLKHFWDGQFSIGLWGVPQNLHNGIFVSFGQFLDKCPTSSQFRQRIPFDSLWKYRVGISGSSERDSSFWFLRGFSAGCSCSTGGVSSLFFFISIGYFGPILVPLQKFRRVACNDVWISIGIDRVDVIREAKSLVKNIFIFVRCLLSIVKANHAINKDVILVMETRWPHRVRLGQSKPVINFHILLVTIDVVLLKDVCEVKFIKWLPLCFFLLRRLPTHICY